MTSEHEFTRWRSLDKPIDPSDPIQPDSPRYEEGKLPVGFIMLLTDGEKLCGPIRFANEEEAESWVKTEGITHFLIVPKPS